MRDRIELKHRLLATDGSLWVINQKFNAEMLAEAMCKLEGFNYAPSDEFYWQHGHSTETDFIYVTTQTLTREQLQNSAMKWATTGRF